MLAQSSGSHGRNSGDDADLNRFNSKSLRRVGPVLVCFALFRSVLVSTKRGSPACLAVLPVCGDACLRADAPALVYHTPTEVVPSERISQVQLRFAHNFLAGKGSVRWLSFVRQLLGVPVTNSFLPVSLCQTWVCGHCCAPPQNPLYLCCSVQLCGRG